MVHIVVIGGSYGGIACVNKLRYSLPKDTDVAITLVESRDARHHCIASYRALVQEDFEKNLWIPYTNLFPKDSPHKIVQGTVEGVYYDHIILAGTDRDDTTQGPQRIDFDYLVIATGSMVPSPAKMKVKSSSEGLKLLDEMREDLKKSESIVIVGGGACGVELAGEIAYRFPDKQVSLIHGSANLVDYPKYPQSFKDETRRYLENRGVEVILNERIEIEGLTRENAVQRAERIIKLKGSEKTIKSDMQFLSIGISIDTGFLSTLHPPISKDGTKQETKGDFKSSALLNPRTGAIMVKPTLQLDHQEFSHIFAIGDVSNADPVPTCMSAIASGETAARNIVKLIKMQGTVGGHSEGSGSTYCQWWNKLEDYKPLKPVMVLAMNPTGGVCQLPVLGSWFGNLVAWLVKSNDFFASRFWGEMNMKKP
ncbi:Apoptosis-inducing factor 2 [Entomortierella beljakovae]|nr:Apoptosis-inducing factor 2 [Entomortierella beljakovae]